mmetsp:Transcript_38415/g.95422  ORF Transcript_38415/g.95422 Transcript_38415/m.95422 type:complete len:262 (-) Transcript_38415:941-1726(-)
MFAKFASFLCTAAPTAARSCPHCSGPRCCSYPDISCVRLVWSSTDCTNCQLAMAFIIATSPGVPPAGFICTNRTNPANACSFSAPSRSRRSAPHHGSTSSPNPALSCSGHLSARRPSAMAAFSPSERCTIVICNTLTRAVASGGTKGATTSAGKAVAISPADQHALLHTLMLYAATILGCRLATAHSMMLGRAAWICCPHPDLAMSPTRANADRLMPGDCGSEQLASSTSRSAAALADTSASTPAAMPSANPDSKSNAQMT